MIVDSSLVRNNIRIRNFLFFFLLLICPFLVIPFIINEIRKGHNEPTLYMMLSLIMSLCAFLSPPFADLYQHAQVYKFYNTVESDSIIRSNGQDYILYTISSLFARYGIPFEWVRAIFVFISYQINFALFRFFVTLVPELITNKKLFFLVFLCFYLSVPFIWIVNGLRSATADYLMIYAWLMSYRCQRIRSVIFVLLSVWMHFSCFVFIPFILLTMFRRVLVIPIPHLLFVCLFFAFGFAGSYFLTFFFGGTDFSNVGASDSVVDYYTEDLNYSKVSTHGMIALILERLPLLLLASVLLVQKNFFRDKKFSYDKSFSYLMLLLLAGCVSFFIPFQRISWWVYPILMFLVLRRILISLRGTQLVQWMCWANVILQLSYLYGYREVFWNTPFYYLVMPVSFALNHYYPLDFNLVV